MGVGRKHEVGLSLLEVLFAFALVTIAVLGIMAVYTGGLKLSAKGERALFATELSQTMMEVIKEQGFDKIPTARTTFDGRANQAPNADGFPPAPYPKVDDYVVQVTAYQKEDFLKSVTVRVFYDNQNSVVLQTYFTPFD